MALQHGEEDGDELKEKLAEHVSSIFEHEDTDKDGSISHDEFSGPKEDPPAAQVHEEATGEVEADAVGHEEL